MIIVMAGLSGTGKSTLATEIAKALDAVILNKDAVRAAAFPDAVRDYTAEQDDCVMEMIYSALRYIWQHTPQISVVIDGRTFSKRAQVARLLEVTAALDVVPRFIECVIGDDEIAKSRLDNTHAFAANRDFTLYQALQRDAEPLAVVRLTLDTGKLPVPEAVQRSLEYLQGN